MEGEAQVGSDDPAGLSGHGLADAWLQGMPPSWEACLERRKVHALAHVWANLVVPLDLGWGALLTVVRGDRLTTIAHLAVYVDDSIERPDVDWRDDVRLFFDGDREWMEAGERWFLHWLRARRRTEDQGARPAARGGARTGDAVRNRRERDAARAMGLPLPYLATTDRPCRACDAILHLDGAMRWVNDNGSPLCRGGVVGHAPRS